jgi:hypothetical protein
VCFASAAALTLGRYTVPVYEIYKVGEEPRWLEGLDLLSEAGLEVALIPHYDNAEGGHHDTRFCYLGEQRLAALETELPADVFVLGVDEHTGLVLDLDAGTASVVGRSSVTVRKDGRSTQLPAGTTVPISHLRALAAGYADAGAQMERAPAEDDSAESSPAVGTAGSPLLESVARLEAAFADALQRRDATAAASAILELEDELVAWSRDTLQSDEGDRARAALRSMIVRLGEVAVAGARDPAEVVGPFVEAVLEARDRARAEQRWADADLLRDRLVDLGVEVGDTSGGTGWRLLS